MVGKSGVWAHFGSWDFQRAKIYITYKSSDYNTFISTLTKELNFTEDEAKKSYYELNSFTDDRQFNDWIASWPGYGGAAGCAEKSGMLQCNIQMSNNQAIPLQINLSNMEAFISAGENTFYPNSFGYLDGEEYVVKEYEEDLIGYGMVLLNDNRTIALMSPELTGSMFTRLFYLDGAGLDHFEKFDDVVDVSGNRIITWKIKW
jgi:hypothetical protein